MAQSWFTTSDSPSREPARCRRVSGACPTYFRACCREGYKGAAYQLSRGLSSVIDADTPDQYDEIMAPLRAALYDGRIDGDAVLAWFDRELPRCMAIVPEQRRDRFLQGVLSAAEEDDITAQ